MGIRDEFEKWAELHIGWNDLELKRDNEDPDSYLMDITQYAWSAWQAARAQGACEWAEQLDACEFHGSDHEVCAEYSGQVPCARAQGGQGAEPVGWVHSKHLKELESGHPIRVYHQDTPVVFDSKVPVYTQPQPAQQGGYPDCDTCGGAMDYMPWHYATKTERHLHACNECWPKVNPAQPAVPEGWTIRLQEDGRIYFSAPSGARGSIKRRLPNDDEPISDSTLDRAFFDLCSDLLSTPITPQPAQQGSVPEYDLPKGYSVRFDDETGWHWYDDVNDRTTDCVFGSKADAAIGAWKDCSLTRWFDVDGLASYIERNFDPYLAEKVHYSSGPDSRSWQLESFSISTDAYNPEPFSRCLSNFLRQFLFTSTPQPEADGWVRCDERLPTEEDWWVWIYDSEDGDIFHALWRDLKGDYENGHMNLSHWMPTGLKRPQPPKEGE